ncbi:MAG: redoxin domain-containing protein [Proteobacteria bacterium]|nr:redoxin domain-containing protein [Pseudomonadota bacterium]
MAFLSKIGDKDNEIANQESSYLYPRFNIKHYDLEVFPGPAAGEPAVDFTLTDFDGNEYKLSDFRGKWVVLETGTATCTAYSKNIDRNKELRSEFSDVEFLLIYVREAHPGERLPQHHSFEDKLKAAKILPKRYGEDRKILIDTLDGQMHRAYGSMPNVVYVINPDGIVHYRCDWGHVERLREALSQREHIHTVEHVSMEDLMDNRGIWIAVRTMWTGGLLALWDFFIGLSDMIKHHKEYDDYYKKHGKFMREP